MTNQSVAVEVIAVTVNGKQEAPMTKADTVTIPMMTEILMLTEVNIMLEVIIAVTNILMTDIANAVITVADIAEMKAKI